MIRRLFEQGSVYAIAAVVAKVGGLALLVVYVNEAILPKADFGNLGVLDATKSLGLLVAGVGLPIGMLRFASSSGLSDRERAAVPATALLIASLMALGVGTLGWVLAPTFATWLPGVGPGPFRWLAVFIAFRTIADISMTELRHREKTGTFVLASTLEVSLLVAGVLFFLVVRGEGLEGVLKGYAVSAVGLAIVLTPILLSHIDRRVLGSLVGPMLAFSAPLIASGLAGRFLNLGDRYLIVAFLGPELNAEYELAARFGGLVNTLVVQSFGMAFTVLGLKALSAHAEPSFHRRSFRHFAALAGFVTLALGLAFSDLVALLPTQDPAYARADGLVVLTAGGFSLYGLYYITVNVLYAAGRTRAVAATVGLAALVNLALNLLLIPSLGLAGAALATLLAYGVLAYATGYAAEQSLRVGYSWRSVLWVGAVVAGLWIAGQPADDWTLGARVALRAGLLVVYPAALYGLGVYTREDWRRGRQLVAERRGSTAGARRRRDGSER